MLNRDLSWLSFNERVLQEAADHRNPLIERLRFVGIFSNNLDEFFRVRYAVIKHNERSILLEQINNQVNILQQKSLDILESITQELKKENIYIINEKEILP